MSSALTIDQDGELHAEPRNPPHTGASVKCGSAEAADNYLLKKTVVRPLLAPWSAVVATNPTAAVIGKPNSLTGEKRKGPKLQEDLPTQRDC